MKLLMALAILFTLTACGSMLDKNGNPVSVQDDFDCKQKCNYFDPRSSIIGTGNCMIACKESKGYRYIEKK
jgi:hypothetical protein